MENCDSNKNEEKLYRSFKQRWLVLLAVLFLTIANNILWISFAAVSSLASEYYQVEPGWIDMLTIITFIVGIPFCLVSTWIIDRLGLRNGIWIAAGLTFIAGFLRFLSTCPGLNEKMSTDAQYWIGFIAQAFTGMGNPIAVSLPTKVSQHWFTEKQRTMATEILALSLPIGIAIGFGGTTLLVNESDDIPLMNIVWFIPAFITMLFSVIVVRTSKPPSPPSRSAEFDQENQPYMESMKKLLTNGQFWILLICVGGAVGYFNAFLTVMQRMMCSRGYATTFAGLCGTLVLVTGVIGAVGGGLIAEKTGRVEEVAKVMFAIAVWAAIGISEFMRKPDMNAALAIFCAIFGTFSFGAYPLALELSVETTYPVDEAAGTALIFLSGQVQGAILILFAELLNEPLLPVAQPIAKCEDNDSNELTGEDYTNFLMVLAGFMTFLGTLFIGFYKTDYKRTRANQLQSDPGQQPQRLNSLS